MARNILLSALISIGMSSCAVLMVAAPGGPSSLAPLAVAAAAR